MSSAPSGDAAPSKGGEAIQHKDEIVHRGVYRTDLLGTATFIGLRALDPLLQYQILARGLGSSLLSKLGLTTIPLSAAGSIPAGNALLDRLGLPLPRLIALAMSAGCSAKHIWWVTSISREEFTAPAATVVSLFNTIFICVNSLLVVASPTSAALASGPEIPIPGTGYTVSLPIALGSLLFVAGTAVEIAAETQRKAFKARPENKGKLCSTGWWGLARHINYGAYTLSRTGYALATGSWPLAVVIGAFNVYQFLTGGTVELDAYMASKYGEQWKKYRADVPWLLFPYLY